MRRKLFFLLEKLEVKRSERIAFSLSLILLLITSSFFALSQPKANYDPDHYKELERIFEERSRTIQTERESILARYDPSVNLAEYETVDVAISDTIESDTTNLQREVSVSDLININTANAEELQELPGIGPAYAERIIEWREEHGEFTSKEELLEIRGIGVRRLENISPLIEL